MHPAHSIRHAVGSGTRRHIVGVQSSARTAAGSHGEVFDVVFIAPLFIGARNGMLESRGIGGVARNGNADLFQLHDRHAFGNVVRAIAFDLCAGTVGKRLFVDHIHRFRRMIERRFHIGKAVDSRNNIRRVFSKTVQNNPQGIFSDFIRVLSDRNSAFGGGKRFVPREEAEAFRFFGKEHGTEISVP